MNTQGIILNLASKNKQIVYGQRAINQQIPTYLKKQTKDYDIYTKKPERAAKELVKQLGSDFEIQKGKYGRTWKVKNKKTGETIADYTQPGRHPKTKNILGVQYASNEFSKSKIKRILRNENAKYRWDKDRETLNRIRQGEVKVW